MLVGLASVSLGVAGVLPFAIGVVAGVLGIALGAAYFASPTWKLEIECDPNGLRVVRGEKTRLSLPWNDVVEVVASPSTTTCFVDGGSAERSLLVPGDGAPASYRLGNRSDLYRQIMAAVSDERVRIVATLDAEE